MAKTNITAERLREVLSYDPDSGVFMWRKTGKGHRKNLIAGSLCRDGYVTIYVDDTSFLAHRLAWLYTNGEWPSIEIDHVNNVRSDNRISNLRLATRSENLQNQRKAHADSASKILGVYWHKQKKKWHSVITINKKSKWLGYFDSQEDAINAYQNAKKMMHPFAPKSA